MARRGNQAPRPTPEADAVRAEHRAEVLVPRNPSLLPLEETKRVERAPKEVTYVVAGPKEVFGHRKGDRVTLALTKSQAEHLLGTGHLVLAEDVPAEPVQGEPVDPVSDDETGLVPEDVKE